MHINLFTNKMALHIDEWGKSISKQTISNFEKAFQKFLNKPSLIKWSDLEPLHSSDIVYLKDIKKNYQHKNSSNFSQIAIFKLNGGLGTSMGLKHAKSSIIIDPINNKTFLDFIKNQIQFLSDKQHKLDLWFLNSFVTQKDTKKILKDFPYYEILQNKFPRIQIIDQDTYKPLSIPSAPELEWYPPGHGDIYNIFQENNILETLLSQKKEYLFISNSDNLGAIPDLSILEYLKENKIDFLMESAIKTTSDIKGGIIVRKNNQIYLLEQAQVPKKHIKDFENINYFPYFNTNNIWINIKALQKALKNNFTLPQIINKKIIKNKPIIQLETAYGSAISNFQKAKILVVPRSRFIPVKHTSDLLLLRSDFYDKSTPFIKAVKDDIRPKISLSSEYKNYQSFQKHFPITPSLKKAISFSIQGDYYFKSKITIIGNVTLKTTTPIHFTSPQTIIN